MKEIAEIQVINKDSANLGQTEPFVVVERLTLKNKYRDGSESRPYAFDMVTLPSFADAVAVVIYTIDNKRKIWIGVREGLRPSVYLRKLDPYKEKLDQKDYLTYREIVAGGIERRDLEPGGIGINGRAVREIFEETGFPVDINQIEHLGGGVFSSPGSWREKIHFRAVRVNPSARLEPKGDGHPLEEVGNFEFIEIRELLTKCHSGEIEDSKTEIGARRLANRLGYIPELDVWEDDLPDSLKDNYSHLGLDGDMAGTRNAHGEHD